MYCKTQSFLILGASKSGFAVATYLLSLDAKCYVNDDSSGGKTRENLKILSECGAVIVKREDVDKVIDAIDVLIISPGVPINHAVAVKCKAAKKRIIGELEFGFSRFNPPTVAITGTNGKTTTVSLISSVLKRTGIRFETVGNIGLPVSSVLSKTDKDTLFLTEVSSFQLESVSSFCPHIACVLNIAPDHLERHYSMDNYVFLKKRIYKNQRESEYTVLNYDDETVRGFAVQTSGKIVWVSLKEVVDGAYLKEGFIFFKGEPVISVSDLALKGEHNVYNAAFAVAVSKLLGVKNEDICGGLMEFEGVKHRLEKVAEKDGIIFYNDSKSTNTAACINALSFMDRPFTLVLGGSEKGEKYDELFKRIAESKCKYVVITGASRYAMLSSARGVGLNEFTLTDDFYTALNIAFRSVKSGEAVLFSPACASFDRFNGYEERGEAFIGAVKNFVGK